MSSEQEKEAVLTARSITERQFYLMVLSCRHCGRGPFDLETSEHVDDDQIDIWYVRCRSCRTGQRLMFDRSKFLIPDEPVREGSVPQVNPTDEPSSLLDVGQWLSLFHAIISAAAEQSDRKEAQRLGYEAMLCLEETLKFYPPDSDLPSPEAFFTESSEARFKEHPEQFARQRLYQMRRKLPSLRVMRAHLSPKVPTGAARSGRWRRMKRWFRRSGRSRDE